LLRLDEGIIISLGSSDNIISIRDSFYKKIKDKKKYTINDPNFIDNYSTDFSMSSISNNNNKDIDENIWDEFSEIFNKNIICNNKSKNISNKSEKNFEGKDDINNYINYYLYKKKLLPIKNEFMEHLNIKKSINQKNNIKYTVTSCHIRVGLKITTFIYYKPKSM